MKFNKAVIHSVGIHASFLFILFVVAGIFFSCMKIDKFSGLGIVEGKNSKKIKLEGKYWRSLYEPDGIFELRVTNISGNDIDKLSIGFNNRFFHTLKDLNFRKTSDATWETAQTSRLVKEQTMQLIFNLKSGNMPLFKIDDFTFKKPTTVQIVADSDTLHWNFDLPLKEGYF